MLNFLNFHNNECEDGKAYIEKTNAEKRKQEYEKE